VAQACCGDRSPRLDVPRPEPPRPRTGRSLGPPTALDQRLRLRVGLAISGAFQIVIDIGAPDEFGGEQLAAAAVVRAKRAEGTPLRVVVPVGGCGGAATRWLAP